MKSGPSNFLVPIFLLLIPTPLYALVNVEPGINMWRLAAAISTCAENIEDSVDGGLKSKICVIESKIDAIAQNGVTAPCGSISIEQTDIPASGTKILAMPGTKYCLSENVTGNFTIAAEDITLDLSDHAMTGTISIETTAPRATVKSGKILAPAPVNSSDGFNGAVHVLAEKAHIFDCCIICADTDPADELNGRVGINNEGDNVTIRYCSVQGGLSGLSTTSIVTTTGGMGIRNVGDGVQILDCSVFGGAGASPDATPLINNAASGSGGRGIETAGSNVCIARCKIAGGPSGSIGDFDFLVTQTIAQGAGNAVVVGRGGDGLFNGGGNVQINDCIINAGASGSMFAINNIADNQAVAHISAGGVGLSNSSNTQQINVNNCSILAGESGTMNSAGFIATNATALIEQGGEGIINNASNVEINGCVVKGAASGSMFAENDIALATSFVATASISAGGSGITSDRNTVTINVCTLFAGSSGSMDSTSGSIARGLGGVPAFAAIDLGGSGVINGINGTLFDIKNCGVTAGDSGSMEAASFIATDSGQAHVGDGGVGIFNSADTIAIAQCTITSGNSGSMTASAALGELGLLTVPTIGSGGNGIATTGIGAAISECIITTGNGGDTTITGTNGNFAQSGDGGIGIFMQAGGGASVGQIKITQCCIIATGNGGDHTIGADPTATFTTVDAGDGGTAVFIDATGQDIDIIGCTIESTGTGGSVINDQGSGGEGGHDIIVAGGAQRISLLENTITHLGAGGSSAAISSSESAGAGGTGIGLLRSGPNIATNIEVVRCIITDTGKGGSTTASSGTATAGRGGHGIFSQGNNIYMDTCTILSTGTGGNSVATAGAAGGSGIVVDQSTTNNRISGCFISYTGFGGTGTTAGNGGDAIFIDSTALNAEVSNCDLSYTGSGLVPGYAIIDQAVAAVDSIVFTNYAHHIAVTPAYIIPLGAAIDSPNGTAFALGTDRLSNVHKP